MVARFSPICCESTWSNNPSSKSVAFWIRVSTLGSSSNRPVVQSIAAWMIEPRVSPMFFQSIPSILLRICSPILPPRSFHSIPSTNALTPAIMVSMPFIMVLEILSQLNSFMKLCMDSASPAIPVTTVSFIRTQSMFSKNPLNVSAINLPIESQCNL